MPSFILIRPTVWPQYTNITDRQTDRTGQWSDSIGRNIGERAFSVAAPRLWNQLPTELKLCQSTALFKRKLKTFLFTASYSVSENNT